MIQLNHSNIPNHRLRKRLTTLREIIGRTCSTIDHYRLYVIRRYGVARR
jgi:hypothetical protein